MKVRSGNQWGQTPPVKPRGLTPWLPKPLVNPLLDDWVELRLEGAALLRVGKHFGGDAAALLRIGNQLMNNVIGVESLDAEFVQEFRKERFPTGNPPG